MANRPTTQVGTGGSGGATRPPSAAIVPARRLRFASVANDNKAPLRHRVIRGVMLATVLSVLAAAGGRALGWF